MKADRPDVGPTPDRLSVTYPVERASPVAARLRISKHYVQLRRPWPERGGHRWAVPVLIVAAAVTTEPVLAGRKSGSLLRFLREALVDVDLDLVLEMRRRAQQLGLEHPFHVVLVGRHALLDIEELALDGDEILL
jgi:hypothetical protein